LQDGLNLGAEARMNVPGTIDGNWRWRVADASIAGDALDRLRGPTEAAHR
jgi:4-alpha-glucanotransferase